MNARTKSLLLTGVTGVAFVAHTVWVVVGAWCAFVGSLSWLTYFGVGLLSFLAVRGALSVSERSLSYALRSTVSGERTNEAE